MTTDGIMFKLTNFHKHVWTGQHGQENFSLVVKYFTKEFTCQLQEVRPYCIPTKYNLHKGESLRNLAFDFENGEQIFGTFQVVNKSE